MEVTHPPPPPQKKKKKRKKNREVIKKKHRIIFLCIIGKIRLKISIIITLKEKNGVILTKKVKSLADLRFNPGIRVIGEYLSQFDSESLVEF